MPESAGATTLLDTRRPLGATLWRRDERGPVDARRCDWVGRWLMRDGRRRQYQRDSRGGRRITRITAAGIAGLSVLVGNFTHGRTAVRNSSGGDDRTGSCVGSAHHFLTARPRYQRGDQRIERTTTEAPHCDHCSEGSSGVGVTRCAAHGEIKVAVVPRRRSPSRWAATGPPVHVEE